MCHAGVRLPETNNNNHNNNNKQTTKSRNFILDNKFHRFIYERKREPFTSFQNQNSSAKIKIKNSRKKFNFEQKHILASAFSY